ncbi:MAG: SDR family oxidoreductase [Bdellovibrionales bacterium]|nr:SDR family oxidoreductase [Bdellovibrionales bacterium]
MKIDFSNKTVLVTGGTRGIGLTIAQAFQQAGAKLIVTGRSKDRPAHTLESLAADFEYLSVDFSCKDSTKKFLENIGNLHELHVCVNNAGVARHTRFEEVSEADWDVTQATNLKGPFLLSQAAARLMKRQNYGRIVNISSIRAYVSTNDRTAYTSSKFGLRGLTVSSALELAQYNILVNDVAPGFTKTEMLVESYSSEELSATAAQIPLKRLGETEDIANAVLFLASDLNNYITGQSLVVDGGFCLQ